MADIKDIKINYHVYDYYKIEDEYRIILMLGMLHKYNVISRESLLGRFKVLRSKIVEENYGYSSLQWSVNTYKCSITANWFDHERMITVISDAVDKKLMKHCSFLDLDELIFYFNLYNGKHFNYNLVLIHDKIVKPFIKTFLYEHNFCMIEAGLDWNFKLPYDNSRDGYCCPDCDGELELYMSHRREHGSVVNYVNNEIEHFFRSKIKGSYKCKSYEHNFKV